MWRIPILATLWCVTGLSLADDRELLFCRDVADTGRRLQCYDAIVAVTGAEAGRGKLEQFGLEKSAPGTDLDAIESSILGDFDSWRPNDKIHLANGQVWQIADDSRGVVNTINAKVKVRRGALSAYYLEIYGSNHSPRVRRINQNP